MRLNFTGLLDQRAEGFMAFEEKSFGLGRFDKKINFLSAEDEFNAFRQ